MEHIVTQVEGIAASYVINSNFSKFTVQVFAGGLLSAFGHNPVIAISDYSGEINLAEEIDQSSLEIRIQSSSLRVASEINDKDRGEIERMMHERILQAADFPEIVYRCSRLALRKTAERQYWAALNGELTLHGVTRSLPVPARVGLYDETLKASRSFSILQSDFSIPTISVAGGSLKVKDELKCSFDMVARKKA